MLNSQTINKLHALKLYGMAEAYEKQQQSSSYASMSFDERLGFLVDNEVVEQDNRRYQRLLKQAKLQISSAYVEDVNYSQQRGLNESMINGLKSCEWIHKGLDIIFTGPAGLGKTWIACAFGHQACREGLKVSFQRLPILLEQLALAHTDGSFHRKLTQLSKVDLLILDDLGVSPINQQGRGDLLEIIDSRSGMKSTIITSQLPVKNWHEYLASGNPTAADSILDRIANGSIRIELTGESMRKLRNKDI